MRLPRCGWLQTQHPKITNKGNPRVYYGKQQPATGTTKNRYWRILFRPYHRPNIRRGSGLLDFPGTRHCPDHRRAAVFLRYRKPSIGAFALLGVITNFATHVLARVLIGAGYMTEYSLKADFVFMWGMVFAPIWAGTFAYIYCKSAIPSKIGPILNQ